MKDTKCSIRKRSPAGVSSSWRWRWWCDLPLLLLLFLLSSSSIDAFPISSKTTTTRRIRRIIRRRRRITAGTTMSVSRSVPLFTVASTRMQKSYPPTVVFTSKESHDDDDRNQDDDDDEVSLNRSSKSLSKTTHRDGSFQKSSISSLLSSVSSSVSRSFSSSWQSWWDNVQQQQQRQQQQQQQQEGYRPPSVRVDDFALLYYDIFLILNLSVSIDVWVVHRGRPLETIGTAFGEGCLLCFCWIAAGLYTGAFLNSAADGHYDATDPRAGPSAAAKLAAQTFVNAMNVRLIVALGLAVLHHRPVGYVGGESLLPLELGLGWMLMTAWRLLHSSFLPRM